MEFWTTISSLATAVATLFLAAATFQSVRSGNRAARAAEQSTLAGLRPLLLGSDLRDPEQKVGFADGKWVHVPGGCGIAEVADDAIYLVMSVHNAARGLAVMHGWYFFPDHLLTEDHVEPEKFRRLTRDIYVPAGGNGFFQGAFRDPDDPAFGEAAKTITAQEPFTIDVLYGDHDGGQRVISRFTMTHRGDGKDGWILSTARHWNVDRPDPR